MKITQSFRSRLSLLLCCAIVASVVLAACGRGADTPAPASAPQPTSSPAPTNTPKPAPTNPPANTANPIQNISWQWTKLTNQTTNETTNIPNPQNYTISFFPDGTLSGKADCNTFSGTYSQQNGFSIKLGAMTQAYCGEASLDQQYTQLLNAVAAGGTDGQGNLALETAGGEQRQLFKNGGTP